LHLGTDANFCPPSIFYAKLVLLASQDTCRHTLDALQIHYGTILVRMSPYLMLINDVTVTLFS